ncbi:hypothetical protein [Herbaspirillum camelliae]|uniref:hypothetical protein n=1 Tax=Herbaspirillum camelliae TaxID=1892903 RepID=UPI001179FF80|nr:hypothetical protein [Herbaspirillum camelliae]
MVGQDVAGRCNGIASDVSAAALACHQHSRRARSAQPLAGCGIMNGHAIALIHGVDCSRVAPLPEVPMRGGREKELDYWIISISKLFIALFPRRTANQHNKEKT